MSAQSPSSDTQPFGIMQASGGPLGLPAPQRGFGSFLAVLRPKDEWNSQPGFLSRIHEAMPVVCLDRYIP